MTKRRTSLAFDGFAPDPRATWRTSHVDALKRTIVAYSGRNPLARTAWAASVKGRSLRLAGRPSPTRTTSTRLSIGERVGLCDDLSETRGDWLPEEGGVRGRARSEFVANLPFR